MGDNGGFYAASRANATGVNVTSEFVVTGEGEVKIRNINGENGLTYDGSINTTGHAVNVINEAGDLTVNGTVKTDKAIMLYNSGEAMTVSSEANVESGEKGMLVNTGSSAMEIEDGANVKNMEKRQRVRQAE